MNKSKLDISNTILYSHTVRFVGAEVVLDDGVEMFVTEFNWDTTDDFNGNYSIKLSSISRQMIERYPNLKSICAREERGLRGEKWEYTRQQDTWKYAGGTMGWA